MSKLARLRYASTVGRDVRDYNALSEVGGSRLRSVIAAEIRNGPEPWLCSDIKTVPRLARALERIRGGKSSKRSLRTVSGSSQLQTFAWLSLMLCSQGNALSIVRSPRTSEIVHESLKRRGGAP